MVRISISRLQLQPHGGLRSVILVSCLWLLLTSAARSGERLVASVERALPYLENEGTWWIEKKKCVSCHHTTFFVWAKELALSKGFSIDADSLADQREWMYQSFLDEVKPNPKTPHILPQEGELNGDRNVEGVSQFLISPAIEKTPDHIIAALVDIISRNQDRSTGHWLPGGQLPQQERADTETQWASNQWATLALNTHQQQPAVATTTWAEGVPAMTSEWHMLNTLLRPQNPHPLANLLKRQNPDGGWSWHLGETSDPSGTGQALIALARSGQTNPQVRDAIELAKEYLLDTKTEKGSWKTQSTKDRSESNRISNFWGTTWAIIGLLEATER